MPLTCQRALLASSAPQSSHCTWFCNPSVPSLVTQPLHPCFLLPTRCSGTSFATPLVAGAAAMVWAAGQAAGRNPTYLQVKQALMSSVDAYASLQDKVTT